MEAGECVFCRQPLRQTGRHNAGNWAEVESLRMKSEESHSGRGREELVRTLHVLGHGRRLTSCRLSIEDLDSAGFNGNRVGRESVQPGLLMPALLRCDIKCISQLTQPP